MSLPFVGVYRKSNKPMQRVPVFLEKDGTYVDMLGNPIDISKMIKVS